MSDFACKRTAMPAAEQVQNSCSCQTGRTVGGVVDVAASPFSASRVTTTVLLLSDRRYGRLHHTCSQATSAVVEEAP